MHELSIVINLSIHHLLARFYQQWPIDFLEYCRIKWSEVRHICLLSVFKYRIMAC